MLGRKLLAADTTLTAPTDFDTAQLAAGELELGFHVEEDEMLVDLEGRAIYSNSAAGDIAFTFYLDGAAAADIPAAGLAVQTVTAGDTYTSYVRTTLRIAKGYHTVELRASASAGNLTYEGAAAAPSELVARRHSHPATLGHGVDSKVQLIQ